MLYLAYPMVRGKAKRGRIFYAVSLLFFALSLFTLFGERGLLHLWRLQGEKKRLDESNFLLQRENELLRERIYRLRHDDAYLEKVAREELGLVRDGEIIYRFASENAGAEKASREDPSRLLPSAARKGRR